MEPWEKALDELSRYESDYPKGYTIIDAYIKPLCDLLTENGFITMHSCSAHVKTTTSNIRRSLVDGEYVIEKGKFKGLGSRSKGRWYVLFVPRWSVEEIQKLITEINYKYGYKTTFKQVNDIDGITNRWVIEEDIEFSFNDRLLFERHKNIYLEFKNYFDSIR